MLELIAKEQGMEDASLRSWMGSSMKVEQALIFALQIARGLQHATTKILGFVHRDLKPENILVGADKLPGTDVNRLRVTDFGLATMLKDASGELIDGEDGAVGRTHLTRGIVGTPLYMAPEQWKGEEIGVYTDVYALGCILYEMLTAKRVVNGQNLKELRSAHCEGRLEKIPNKMTREVKILLERCLSRHPKGRYQEWGKITQELERLYAKLMGHAAPVESSAAHASDDERIEYEWSYNVMGHAYADMGKAEIAKYYFDKSLSIASDIGDQRGISAALGNLGLAYARLGEFLRAIEHYKHSLKIKREIGDQRGEGNTLGNLGMAYAELGEVRRAIEHYEHSLKINREVGNQRGEGVVLGNLGGAYYRLGEVQRAIECCEQQLEIMREIGDRRGEGNALGGLGILYAELGEMQLAIKYYKQQLEITREIGDRRGEGIALGNLGVSYVRLGNMGRAIECYEQDLAITREIGDRRGEGNSLGNLGKAFTDIGEVEYAIKYYEQALAILRAIGDINGVAIHSFNMASLYSKQGETSRALSLAQEAEQIFAQIGSPNVQVVRQLIAQLQSR